MAAHPTSLRAARASSSRVRAMEAAVAAPPQPDYSSASRELASVLKWTLGIPTAVIVSILALYVLGAVWWWGEISGRRARADRRHLARAALADPRARAAAGRPGPPRAAAAAGLRVAAPPHPARARAPLGRAERPRPPDGRPQPPAGATSTSCAAPTRRGPRSTSASAGCARGPSTQKLAQDRRAALSRAVIAFALVVGALRPEPGPARGGALRAVAHAPHDARRACGSWPPFRRHGPRGRGRALHRARPAARRVGPHDPRRPHQGPPRRRRRQSSWHVVVDDDVVKSIPTGQIAKASVYSEQRMVRGPLGARVIDAFR